MLKALLRGFSYFFHSLLALFLLAVSALALISGGRSIHLAVLPWSGVTLDWVVLGGSLFGLLSVYLALRGKWRGLFLLWSAVVAVAFLKGYIFSGYQFSPGEVGPVLGLTAAALVALAGAWFAVRKP